MSNIAYDIGLSAVGKDVTIWERAKIVGPENITIGNSVIIDDFVFIVATGTMSFGDFIHIGSFTCICGGGDFVMEDFSGLSGGVRIYTGNEDYLGGSLTNPTVPMEFRSVTREPVLIKKHAIIGANSVILPGVTIGEGVSVGAGSVVTKDCDPWTVYAGTPARPLKKRPKEKILCLEQELREKHYNSKGYVSKEKL